jgi:release factor glutamine methyltransferase
MDPYAGVFAGAIRVARGDRMLDLGCGSGAYAIAASILGVRHVVATDVDPRAVETTLENARRNRVSLDARVGSLFAPVRRERFDVIVTSLPQLPSPRPILRARYGGPDGLRFLRRLAREGPARLAPGGRLYALVTAWAGPARAAALLETAGLRVRRVARVERPFQPAEYDAFRPGLFDYLAARTPEGRGRWRRAGSWCYLTVSFLEARAGAGS